jgi:hypothetical protein
MIRLRANLPTEPTLRWHRTATYYRQMIAPTITTNDRACIPTIYEPDNRRTNMPAT